MADSALMISWGIGIPGREEMGLGVFMSSMQFWGSLKESGDIEDFHVYQYRNGDVSHDGGMVAIHGSVDQINALVQREDYKTLVVKAGHIVSDMKIAHADTGVEIMKGVERLQAARKELGI